MRVSRRRRGRGDSRCAPGSSLDWGLQRLAGSGVRRLLCGLLQSGPGAQRRGQCSGAMADSALGRLDRAGRGRGRRRSGAAEFRRGRVRSTLIPPGCPPVAADLRGASALAAAPMLVLAKAPGHDPPQRDRTGRPGLLCHIGSSLAQSHCAPGANGPRFCALAFRLWRIALAPPPLPSPPLPPFLFL